MKNIIRYLLFAICFLLFAIYSYTGNLDNPVTITPTMYTLSDINNKISSGTVAGSHPLFPVSAPGSTGVTLQFIYDSLPGGTTTTALETDVVNGKTFIKRGNGAMTFATGTTNFYFLPDTGQYGNYSGSTGDGEDGDYNPVTSSPSYKMYNYVGGALVQTSDVNKSSVTVDNITGLMWVTDANKYNGGAAQIWTDALSGCEGFSYAGYTDWRLPNIKELFTIVDFGTTNAVKINGTYFKNQIEDFYWSSTTSANLNSSAWDLYFGYGGVTVYDKALLNYVRPVRGGQ